MFSFVFFLLSSRLYYQFNNQSLLLLLSFCSPFQIEFHQVEVEVELIICSYWNCVESSSNSDAIEFSLDYLYST